MWLFKQRLKNVFFKNVIFYIYFLYLFRWKFCLKMPHFINYKKHILSKGSGERILFFMIHDVIFAWYLETLKENDMQMIKSNT